MITEAVHMATTSALATNLPLAPNSPSAKDKPVMNRDTATGHVTGPYVYKPFPFSLLSLV